jgi:hypothetical protein
MGAYERPAAGPSVASAAFLYETGQDIRLQFSGNVGASLVPDDLQIHNLTTGQNVATPMLTMTSGITQATWSFVSGPWLPDGNYRVTLPAGSVSDTYSNTLAGDFTFDFFIVAADANRDRVVDITDLGILATNWQQSPRTFSQGDFNYDDIVDITDLGMLATNWQTNLPPPGAVFRAAAARKVNRAFDLVTY